VDTGVTEGSEISVYYDPMVAKLITTGATREAALNTMGAALDRCALGAKGLVGGQVLVQLGHGRQRLHPRGGAADPFGTSRMHLKL
jgi:hypothetical protein